MSQTTQFLSDDFERVRENTAEFTTAANASNLFRTALLTILRSVQDKRMAARLLRSLFEIIRLDNVNNRGKRNVTDGPLEKLEGFQFNEKAPLAKIFLPKVTVGFVRDTGEVKIDIPAFVSRFQLQTGQGATHFKFLAAAAEFDFMQDQSHVVFAVTNPTPWSDAETPAQSIVLNVTPNSTKDVVVLFGVQYYQQIGNGSMYPLKSNLLNTLAIVKVDGI